MDESASTCYSLLAFLSKGDPVSKAEQDAWRVFKKHGGVARTGEVLAAGVHSRTLRAMCKTGMLERLSRGLYRLVEFHARKKPDLAAVAIRVPKGVICLTSALAVHGLTDQVPRVVQLALPRSVRYPKCERPQTKVYQMAKSVFEAGIETVDIDGVPVRVYNREKTIADCFKYRTRIGIDVAAYALNAYGQSEKPNMLRLLYYARLCRVEKIMRPYIEASRYWAFQQ
jgi:predicted transcriptional regulator of viral defense system